MVFVTLTFREICCVIFYYINSIKFYTNLQDLEWSFIKSLATSAYIFQISFKFSNFRMFCTNFYATLIFKFLWPRNVLYNFYVHFSSWIQISKYFLHKLHTQILLILLVLFINAFINIFISCLLVHLSKCLLAIY